jgi:hypothetical protein
MIAWLMCVGSIVIAAWGALQQRCGQMVWAQNSDTH